MANSNCFLESLRKFDLFGIPIQIFHKQKTKFQSTFGALMVFLILAISFFFLIKQFIAWWYLEIMNVISAKENYSVPAILNDNRNMEYTFDHKNYMIYFAISAYFPTYSLDYTDLARYFEIQYYYSPDAVEALKIESEDCKIRETNEFLDLPYNKEDIPVNASNPKRMCIKYPLKMGLFSNLEMKTVDRPTLMMQIRRCQNTTENNNSCASLEEIKSMTKNVYVQATIPNTDYDFKNQSSPIQRAYRYEYYRLDYQLNKLIINDMSPSFLYKDYGLINDDYRLESVNFNPTQQVIDFNSVQEDDPMLFDYEIAISNQKVIYYMRNQKLNDIFGTFGGIVSILFSIGGFICIKINEYLYVHTLLNVAFRFKPIEKEKKKTTLANE